MTWLLSTRLGRATLGLCILAAIVASLWAGHRRAVRLAYEQGRADVQRDAALVATKHDAKVIIAQERTDSSAATVTRRITDVRKAIAKALEEPVVPPSQPSATPSPLSVVQLPSLPDTGSMKAALRSCLALTNDCEEFRNRAMAERAARDSQIIDLRVMYGARGDTIQRWQGRITKKKAVAWSAGAAVVTYLIMRK